MLVLVPLAVGLKVKDTVQPAPPSMVRPQSLAWAKSDGSFPAIVRSEIANASEVLLVMTIFVGRLCVSTGCTGKKIAERDNRILKAGRTGAEACHQVAELLGASEPFQFEGLPERSRADGSTPIVS